MLTDHHSWDQAGFTILEILVVMIVIGIVSAVVVSRSDVGQPKLLARTEAIKAHIRYAQSRSMNSSRPWGIHVNATGQAYALFVDGNVTNRRLLPGEDSDWVDLSALGLNLAPANTTVSFDDRGRPLDSDGTTVRTNDINLAVTAVGGDTTAIRITRNTGFVP